MFTFREEEGLPGLTWCLKFNEDSFGEWKDRFTTYLWEGKNRMSYAKAKADEQRYIQNAYEDVEMEEPEEEDAEEEQEDEVAGDVSTEGAFSDDEGETSASQAFRAGSKNEQLAVGYRNDLSFVTRGNQIGVFAPKEDRLRFRTTIDRVKDLHGKDFSPRKVSRCAYRTRLIWQMMLHNQDSDMLLLDPSNPNSVFRLDLEYGKVVDEWKVSENVAVSNILPE